MTERVKEQIEIFAKETLGFDQVAVLRDGRMAAQKANRLFIGAMEDLFVEQDGELLDWHEDYFYNHESEALAAFHVAKVGGGRPQGWVWFRSKSDTYDSAMISSKKWQVDHGGHLGEGGRWWAV